MKVLMFGWEFPPHISGGLGTACFGLTRSLVAQGVDITFVLPKVKQMPGKPAAQSHVTLVDAGSVPPPKAAPGRPAAQSVPGIVRSWHRQMEWLEVDSPLAPYLSPETYGHEFTGRETAVESTARTEHLRWLDQAAQSADGLLHFSGDYAGDLLGEVMRYGLVGARLGATETFDVIHAHDWMAALAGSSAKEASGKPLVFHVHATEFDRCGDHGDERVMALERLGMERADKVVAVSHRTKQTVMEKYGIPEWKIKVVHNAVEKDSAVHRSDIPFRFRDKIVLFLGRITHQKGPEYFIDAARIVLDRWRHRKSEWKADGVDGVRFVMAGSGDMLPRMIERAAGFKMVDRFHFTGFLRGADVDRMFATCDLYVLPSVSEPFGITPLEAMKHDVPVILSKQSGVAEILPHATTVDFWDVRETARAIEAILRSAPVTRRQLELNQLALDQITWDGAADRLRALYAQLCP